LLSVLPTGNWGVAQDSPLIHYVVFLAAHGFAPYRDIVEMNMPGAYMTDWAVMHLLGPGDIAWRSYDLLLMLIASLAAWSILRPWGRFPAYFAALLTPIYHIGNGRTNVGQRDYCMAVLLLVGYAFLFYGLRNRRAWPMAILAMSFGWAAAIKPTVVPFAAVPLLLAIIALRRRRMSMVPYIAWALAGAVVPVLIVAAFLHHYHAGPPFLELLRGLAPYHRGNGNLALYRLLLRWIPWVFYPLGVAFLVVAIPWPRNRRFEFAALLAALLFGIASYIYQGKGWNYHDSTAMLFLIVLTAALSASRGQKTAAIALTCAALLPMARTTYLQVRHGHTIFTMFRDSLTADVVALGGPALSGHLQCLDWNEGCIEVLYRQRIVQSTGFIYDFYLFPSHPAPVTVALQQRFLTTVESTPPKYIILTSSDWPDEQGFAKLDRWPAFKQWLDAHYVLQIAKHPEGRTAYRIYALR
jgi:hypothetical protein